MYFSKSIRFPEGFAFWVQHPLQSELFRVFQRLHSPREFEGQGIGLALARRVVARHGGSIRATGAVGKGCCVSLTLPV